MPLHTGVCGHRKRVCNESCFWEKNPYRTGETKVLWWRAGPALCQLSYIPTHTYPNPPAPPPQLTDRLTAEFYKPFSWPICSAERLSTELKFATLQDCRAEFFKHLVCPSATNILLFNRQTVKQSFIPPSATHDFTPLPSPHPPITPIPPLQRDCWQSRYCKPSPWP